VATITYIIFKNK